MRFMRQFVWVGVLALMSGAPRLFAQSFTFTITAVKDTVKAGSEVRLKIRLANTSEHDISMTAIPWGKEDHPEIEGFRPTVTNSQGLEPPLTQWGRLVFGRPAPTDNPPNLVLNSVSSYGLEPGKTYTSEIIVSDLYDMATPGKYNIQVPYKASYFGVPLNGGKQEESHLQKPSVTVTVLP